MKTIKETVDSLTAQEKERFKDLIEETEIRAKEIQEAESESLSSIKYIEKNHQSIQESFLSIMEDLKKLSKASESLLKALQKSKNSATLNKRRFDA